MNNQITVIQAIQKREEPGTTDIIRETAYESKVFLFSATVVS